MVRKLQGQDQGQDLDGWLNDAEESRSTAMRSFAAGLSKDLDTYPSLPSPHSRTTVAHRMAAAGPGTSGEFPEVRMPAEDAPR